MAPTLSEFPDELLTEIIAFIKSGCKGNHAAALTDLAFVSKKFARCTQEVLFRNIDFRLFSHKTDVRTWPPKGARLFSLFRTLLSKPSLAKKVRSLHCGSYGVFQVKSGTCSWDILQNHIKTLAIPENLKELWLKDTRNEQYDAILSGVISIVPNLRQLCLQVNDFFPYTLAKFFIFSLGPILGSLQVLELEAQDSNGIQLSEAYYRDTYSNTSYLRHPSLRLRHPSLRKLCIRDVDDRSHGYVTAPLHGVSGITDLSIDGTTGEETLKSLLRCFKGLKSLQCTGTAGSAWNASYVNLDKIFDGLRAHQDTLERLTIEWDVQAEHRTDPGSSFSFARFNHLRTLTISSKIWVSSRAGKPWVNQQCAPGIIAQLLANSLPTSLTSLDLLDWGYSHACNPEWTLTSSKVSDGNADLEPLRCLIPWLQEDEGLPNLRCISFGRLKEDFDDFSCEWPRNSYPRGLELELYKTNVADCLLKAGVEVVIRYS
ncbi:hypothetical protein BU16DRAFT_531371 [Lophium mytilinum]|uniref:F-box domain-containing protein n=1 Tax=Lophium mytilinum TaxID=390894 RepID=A0A6A6QDA8_9PEZI|nr:hypothetical protein BU16DRAFT_531371 [Lophium mytilinum]